MVIIIAIVIIITINNKNDSNNNDKLVAEKGMMMIQTETINFFSVIEQQKLVITFTSYLTRFLCIHI